MRAAIYTRISRDRTGTGAGVERQLRECRELAERRDWTVVDVYEDDDRSAYSGKPRPAYRRLLEDLKAGTIDGVVAWHQDRLQRSPRELEDFVDVVESAGATVATVQSGDVDLSTPDGRMTARVVGAMARRESEHRAARLRSKHRELAAAGGWQGGPRPYGWIPAEERDDVDLEVVAAEAEVIRSAADRVLAGESLYAIARDLNAAGVPTVRESQWRTPSLRSVLTTPKVAGLREHRGEIVGPGRWEPILDEHTWRRVRAALEDPARSRTGRPARTHLLTGGVALCAECGAPLHAARRARKSPDEPGVRLYKCLAGPNWDGCGGVQIVADRLEELVVEAIYVRLDSSELARAIDMVAATGTGDDVEAELADVLERLDVLAEEFGNGRLDARQWKKARGPLEARRGALEERRARSTGTEALAGFVGREGALRQAWEGLSLDQRRTIVREVIGSVTVSATKKRGPVFDPSRVDVEWRI